MPTRVDNASPLWICCCCGGLPLLGAAKAVVFAPPLVVLVTLCCTLTTLLCIPHDIYLTYSVVCTTACLGRNLRVLLVLLLPVMLAAWPVCIFAASLLGSTFYFAGMIAWSVFEADRCVLNPELQHYPEAWRELREFWRFNCNSVFEHVHKMQYIPSGWDGQVYEIPLAKVMSFRFPEHCGSGVRSFPPLPAHRAVEQRCGELARAGRVPAVPRADSDHAVPRLSQVEPCRAGGRAAYSGPTTTTESF